MRFSRAKPTGSFRVFQPGSRAVASHNGTLKDARKSAAYWTSAVGSTMEIQERFPSGEWVTVQTVTRKFPSAVKRSASKRPRATKRTAHATKAKKSDKVTDKTTIAALAEMFGLPAWDKIDDLNQDHYWEMARGAECEEAQLEAEREAQDEVFAQWYDAVERTASKLFEEHGLELHPAGKNDKRPFELKIAPQKSWNAAADKIRETINGVGMFHFNNLREFLDSGPYTAREAVLGHLRSIKDYPSVYGGTSARQMYENAWR